MIRKNAHREPTKSIHIKVPGSLFREVKLLLLNPTSGRVRHGEMSKLATSLFRTWVEKQRKEFVEDKTDTVYQRADTESSPQLPINENDNGWVAPNGDPIKKEIEGG